MVFNPAHVFSAPGTLYAAPLGTTEPTSVTGAWPAGWTALGYTDQGSELDITPTWQAITVEEEVMALTDSMTDLKVTIAFALAETTQQNLLFALNGGIGTGQVSGSSGTNPDGSIWTEIPAFGSEARVMLGWDALPEGATQGQFGIFRWVLRKTIQTGSIKQMHRKGSNKTMYAVTFTLEKAAGVQPFRAIQPATYAA